jgi:hypothetical protein
MGPPPNRATTESLFARREEYSIAKVISKENEDS